jgi:signal transduction histidine kinase
MNRTFRQYLILCHAIGYFLVLYNYTFAQGNNATNSSLYFIQQYNDQNGLPQNSVNGIARDKDGFIWLATEGGLVRFDGRKFYTFDNTNLNVNSSRVNYILPDLRKPFDKLYSNFEYQQSALRIENGQVVDDSSAVGNFYRRFFQIKGVHMDAYITTGYPNWVDKFFYPKYYIIPIGGKEGSYFYFTENRLTFYSNWKKIGETIFRELNCWDFFRLGTSLFIRQKEGKFEKVFPAISKHDKSTQGNEFQLTGDILRDAHYGKKSPALYWNNFEGQAFLAMGENLYQMQETPDGHLTTALLLGGFDCDAHAVTRIYHDERFQRIYIGSRNMGLFVIHRRPFSVVSRPGNGADNVFYAQIAADSNAIQTPDGLVLGKSGGQNGDIIEKGQIHHRRNMWKYRIQETNNGELWTANYESLFCFEKGDSKYNRSWHLPDGISDIYSAPDGHVWIALVKNALYKVDASDPNREPRLYASLPLNTLRLNFLLQSGDDALWVGTDGGLYKFHLKTRKLILVKGTESFNIRNLYARNDQATGEELWIATYNMGFALFKDQRLTQFPLDRHGYLSSAHYLMPDNKDFFWIPTNKGLFQVSRRELLDYAAHKDQGSPFYMYYNVDDGFLTNEFNGGCRPCAVRLPNGFVSVPSLNGLVWFKPEEVVPESPANSILVDRIEENGKVIFRGNGPFVLPQTNDEVKLFVTTAFFGNQENLHLSYALSDSKANNDQSWFRIEPNEGAVNISRLDRGSHFLHIRKRNGFGVGNYSYQVVELEVLPHWFETWPFRFSVLIVIAFLIYQWFRYKTRNMMRTQKMLETKIAQRTSDLEEMLYSLKNSEQEMGRQLNLYVRMLAAISHDVRTPLKFIRNASETVRKFLSQSDGEEALQANEMITHTSERLFQLLENMVAFTKSEIYDNKIDFKKVNLHDLVSEKAEFFKQILTNRRSTLEIALSRTLEVYTNPKLLAVIIHNLIDNAIKIQSANHIRIYEYETVAGITLVISDQGPGLPLRFMDWLNDPQTQIPDNYDGLGLTIVKEICQVLQIGIEVKNENGAHFYLSMKNHFPAALED